MPSLGLKERFAAMGDSFANMSPRERWMVTGMAAGIGLLALSLLWYLISDGLDRREERNRRMNHAMTLLSRHEGELRDARLAEARADARIDKPAPALQGHLHKIAEDVGIEVKEWKPGKKPKPLGKTKRYQERYIRLRMYRVELDPLTKFLDKIESGRHLIMISKLEIQTRPRQHELLDVDMVVSTYEKTKKTAKKGKAKGKKTRRKARAPSRPR
jgi:hypothetical protein